MAQAEGNDRILVDMGPKPGVKYPLNVLYCPQESKAFKWLGCNYLGHSKFISLHFAINQLLNIYALFPF